MKKYVVLFLLLTLNCVYASERHIIRQNPYVNNPYYRHSGYYQAEVLPRDLNALERYSMNKVYYRESPIKRLERLENLAFGAIQEGDIYSRYKNVESAILSRPQNQYKRNLWSNVANYFAGQATGITPSVFQQRSNFDDVFFNNYPSNGYGNQRFNQYSNGIFGGGYSMLNNSIGNGSSIRILD